MPDLGRWFNVDPLAELSPELTPYRFGFNNPLSFTDPTGMYEDGYGDYDDYGDDYAGHFDIDFYRSGWEYGHSDLWNIINFKWTLDIDIALGTGDGYAGDDYFADNMNDGHMYELMDDVMTNLLQQDGNCSTCPQNAKDYDTHIDRPFSIFDRNTWENYGHTKIYTYYDGAWHEPRYLIGDVPIGPGGIWKGVQALRNLPKIDATRKVHGYLPRVKDFKNFDKGQLNNLLESLKISVQQRIKSTVLKGPKASKIQNKKHGERQSAEQDLIKSLEKYLNNLK